MTESQEDLDFTPEELESDDDDAAKGRDPGKPPIKPEEP